MHEAITNGHQSKDSNQRGLIRLSIFWSIRLAVLLSSKTTDPLRANHGAKDVSVVFGEMLVSVSRVI